MDGVWTGFLNTRMPKLCMFQTYTSYISQIFKRYFSTKFLILLDYLLRLKFPGLSQIIYNINNSNFF